MASPTLAEYVAEDWAPRFAQLKPSTQQRSMQGLKRHLLPWFGTVPLDQITRRMVYRWFDEHSQRAPADANRTLAVLQGILSHAVEREVIDKHPALRMKMNHVPGRTRFLDHGEINRLHEALDNYPARSESGRQQVDVIRILLLTGMRCSEVSQLAWSEVKAEDSAGRTQKALTYASNWNLRKPTRLELSDSKTGPRTVPIGLPVATILQRQPSIGVSPWVFPDPRDESGIRPRSRHICAWYKIRATAALGDVRLHDLRHTFASHAAMRGVPLPVLASILGHSAERVTARYSHITDRAAAAAAESTCGMLARRT